MIILLVLFPLLLAALVTEQRVRKQFWMFAAAPLPMLLVAAGYIFHGDGLASGETALVLNTDWLLLGVYWRVSGGLVTLLAVTALLWLLAGVYSWQAYQKNPGEAHLARYLRCWLLTLTGNFGVLVAGDIASFYSFFALMTFAAYGLVIHFETRPALFAGRIYIAMAVLGEALLLSGLLWGAHLITDDISPLLRELPRAISASEQGPWVALLLFTGFGVKAGLAGLHWWLPLAHPVAPTPASAVLSGAMIKAGLVGWMLTLPLGEFSVMAADYSNIAWLAIGLGLIGAYGAAAMGVFAQQAKTVLAYSSVSQMGMLTCMLGVGWLYPQFWLAIFAAMLAFAMHHGVNKTLLFLGVGIRKRIPAAFVPLLLVLMAIPALNLIGLPFTSGAYAKDLFKAVLTELPQPLIYAIFSYAALATTALILRFAWLLR